MLALVLTLIAALANLAACIAEGTRGDWGQVPISAGLMFMTPFLYRVMVS